MRIVITEEQYNRLFVKEPISLRDEFDYIINEQDFYGGLRPSIGWSEKDYSDHVKHVNATAKVYSDFAKWIGTWTVQDWIDAAAVAALIMAPLFPPLALIALDLEAINLGISTYNYSTGKGSAGDVGLRTIFLFGGPLIGRVIGGVFSLGGKAITKIFRKSINLFKRISNLGGKATKKQIENILEQEFKGFSKKEKDVAKKLIEDINDNPNQWKNEMEKIEELVEKVKNGDKEALQKLKDAQKAAKKRNFIETINPFSKNKDYTIKTFRGDKKVNKYWHDIFDFPRSKFGLTVLSGIFIGFKSLEFYVFLEQKGIEDEAKKAVMSEIAEKSGFEKKSKEFCSRWKKDTGNECTGDIRDDWPAMADSNSIKQAEVEDLIKNVNIESGKFMEYYEKTLKITERIKNDKNTLVWLYNNTCVNNNGSTKYADKFGYELKSIKNKDVYWSYKEYLIFPKGKYAGIWKPLPFNESYDKDYLKKFKGYIPNKEEGDKFRKWVHDSGNYPALQDEMNRRYWKDNTLSKTGNIVSDHIKLAWQMFGQDYIQKLRTGDVSPTSLESGTSSSTNSPFIWDKYKKQVDDAWGRFGHGGDKTINVKWTNILNDCKESTEIIAGICKESNRFKDSEELCASLELINLSNEEELKIASDIYDENVKSENEKRIEAFYDEEW